MRGHSARRERERERGRTGDHRHHSSESSRSSRSFRHSVEVPSDVGGVTVRRPGDSAGTKQHLLRTRAAAEPVRGNLCLTRDMSGGGAARADMGPEIKAAVSFLVRLLRGSGFLPDTQLQVFRDCLQQALSDRYRHHWFPDRPQKGSGYRCIRINHEMDPLIAGAASRVGLSAERLFSLLPRELTLWIDPYEVSYRIGEDGSICVLYETQPPVSGPAAPSPFDPLNCKNSFLMTGRTSPPKHYLMTVSG